MSKLKVLVTGMGGRIGRHLVGPFQELYDLRVLDRQPVAGISDTHISDLQDREVLKAAMEGADVVLHLAATSDEAPFIENLVPNNVIGLYNVFEAARETAVRRLVFASTVQTVSAYPREHGTIEITDPPRPSTLYGATKILGEVMGRWYHDRHRMEFVGIRIGAFQSYDSEHLRRSAGLRDFWLSPGDAIRLFRRAIEKPEVSYALVFGTSKTTRERLSLRPARELLNYEPEDDAATFAPAS